MPMLNVLRFTVPPDAYGTPRNASALTAAARMQPKDNYSSASEP